jgi:hypothetical protein
MKGGKKTHEQARSVVPDPMPALIRAGKRAAKIARETRTALVIAKDGKPVRVRPRGAGRTRKS